jgi:hypothetical protein
MVKSKTKTKSMEELTKGLDKSLSVDKKQFEKAIQIVSKPNPKDKKK